MYLIFDPETTEKTEDLEETEYDEDAIPNPVQNDSLKLQNPVEIKNDSLPKTTEKLAVPENKVQNDSIAK